MFAVGKHIVLGAILLAGVFLWKQPLQAKDLEIGFSYAKPPYVFAQSVMQVGETRGIELEIVKSALALSGHTFKPRFFSYDNLHGAMKSGKVDAIATVRPEEDWPFYSDEFVYFHNFAIVEKKKKRPIYSLKGLAGRTVVAWQGAGKDLGDAYATAIKSARLYREIGDQQQQVLTFLHGRVDTLVIDGAIFRYWANVLGFNPQDYDYHDIFGGRTNFVVGFISRQLRDQFNEGLNRLKDSGEYDRIFAKYVAQ